MGNSFSTLLGLAKGKKFRQTFFYVQHVDEKKDKTSETSDRYLEEYLVKGCTNFPDHNFTEYLKDPKANLKILKKSLEDRVTFVKICSHPLHIDLQLSDVPIHEYVVFKTENYSNGNLRKTCWSLETNGQQIVLQQSPNKDDVINKIYDAEQEESVERSERPVRNRENNCGPFRMVVEDLLRAIWNDNQKSEPYHLLTSNSHLFASFIFEKISATVIGGGLSKVDAFKYRSILYDQNFDYYRTMMEGKKKDFEKLTTNSQIIKTLNDVDSQGFILFEWGTVFSTPHWPIDKFLKEKGAEIPSGEEELFRRNLFLIELQYLPPNQKSKYLSLDGIHIIGVNQTGDTALHLALYGEKWHIAGEILNRFESSDVDRTNIFGETPLHLAAKLECEIGLFTNILNRTNKKNINKADGNGCTALHYAMDNKSETKVRELLNHKKVVVNNIQNNEDNSTALHLASNWPTIPMDLFKRIQKRSTSDTINAQNKNGNTALHIAFLNNFEDAIKMLLENDDVNVNVKNNENRTPLHVASLWKAIPTDLYEKIVQKSLLETVNAQDKDGNTALHIAISCKSEVGVKELLKHRNVNVDVKNNYNHTVFYHAPDYWKDIPQDLLNKISVKSVSHQRKLLLSIFIAIIAIGANILYFFCMQINTSFLVFKTETP